MAREAMRRTAHKTNYPFEGRPPPAVPISGQRFKCSICKRKFEGKSAKRDCNRHSYACKTKIIVMENDKKAGVLRKSVKIKSFTCKYCIYATKNREHAFRHVYKQHPKEIPTNFVKINCTDKLPTKARANQAATSPVAAPKNKIKASQVTPECSERASADDNDNLLNVIKSLKEEKHADKLKIKDLLAEMEILKKDREDEINLNVENMTKLLSVDKERKKTLDKCSNLSIEIQKLKSVNSGLAADLNSKDMFVRELETNITRLESEVSIKHCNIIRLSEENKSLCTQVTKLQIQNSEAQLKRKRTCTRALSATFQDIFEAFCSNITNISTSPQRHINDDYDIIGMSSDDDGDITNQMRVQECDDEGENVLLGVNGSEVVEFSQTTPPASPRLSSAFDAKSIAIRQRQNVAMEQKTISKMPHGRIASNLTDVDLFLPRRQCQRILNCQNQAVTAIKNTQQVQTPGHTHNAMDELRRWVAQVKAYKKPSAAGSNKLLHCEEDENRITVHKAFEATPHYIQSAEMKDFQIDGLNWMIALHFRGRNGILADDMGLGKTVQTIAFIGYLKNTIKKSAHHIIIVPKSTLKQWEKEFGKWCPTVQTICLIGSPQQRRQLIRDMENTEWDVCITTYEMCICENQALKQFPWHYMIVDEGHRLKNEKIKLSSVLHQFNPTNRFLLTGTPFQNTLHELWVLLNFIDPHEFSNSTEFDNKFTPQECLRNQNLIDELQGILKPFILRRLKCEVAKELKPKREFKKVATLQGLQKLRYTEILQKNMLVYNGEGDLISHEIRNLMIELRKCCNHPYLIDKETIFTNIPDLVHNCGKMKVLDEILAKLLKEESRVLLFSQMKRMLDIFEQYCTWRSYEYLRLDGDTEYSDRDNMIAEFNSAESAKFIFMMTTHAGGVGINLQSANAVIIYDSDWNPQADCQAIDRVHRIGQTKEVKVYRLITKNTVEESVIRRAGIKLRLNELVIQKGPYKGNEEMEIAQVIRDSANSLFGSSTKHSVSSAQRFCQDNRSNIT